MSARGIGRQAARPKVVRVDPIPEANDQQDEVPQGGGDDGIGGNGAGLSGLGTPVKCICQVVSTGHKWQTSVSKNIS